MIVFWDSIQRFSYFIKIHVLFLIYLTFFVILFFCFLKSQVSHDFIQANTQGKQTTYNNKKRLNKTQQSLAIIFSGKYAAFYLSSYWKIWVSENPNPHIFYAVTPLNLLTSTYKMWKTFSRYYRVNWNTL